MLAVVMKTAMVYIILSVSALFLAAPGDKSVKEVSYEKKLEIAAEAVYQTDWQKADNIFRELKKERPDDPFPHFFESIMPFWEYFLIGPEKELADEFFEITETAVRLSEKQLKRSPGDTTMVFLMSGLYGYRSLVAAGENRYSEALKNGLAGYRFTRKLLSLNADRPDAQIGKGMFYYMTGSIPVELKWASNAIGLHGSKEQGFEELKKAAGSNSYISTDAKIMLMYLYEREEKYSEAFEYAEQLTRRYTSNVIFKFRKARLLDQLGRHEDSEILWKEIAENSHPDLPDVTRLARQNFVH